MGLSEQQKMLIRAVTENDLPKAKQHAIACLAEDDTRKNHEFVVRYKARLQSKGANIIELPYDVASILSCEDVSVSFMPGRYYLTKTNKELADRIFRTAKTSGKLMEMLIPYRNLTLLYGKPGTGKTTFGRYIAYAMKLPFCYLNFSKLVDSLMGATAKNITKAFAYATSTPCVLMLDEVDSICSNRKSYSDSAGQETNRITITLLQELDRLPNDVIVIAATNRLDILDTAF